jgi:hypothetical protein
VESAIVPILFPELGVCSYFSRSFTMAAVNVAKDGIGQCYTFEPGEWDIP